MTIRCAASSAAVTMPLPHGLRRIEVELPEGDDGAWLDDEAEVRRRLRRGWAGAAHAPIVGVSRRRFKAVVAERWRSGRIFLAGDAAHLMPPFAGQGLCAGLRDAANLSFKIAGAHQGWLSPEVLDTYEEERRPHVDRMTRLACRLGRVMSPRTAGEGALVHGALRAIGRAPAVASRWLLRGPRIQPALASGMFVPCGSAGRYLPQPMVAAADGRRVPLDELLGSRLTWVILEGFVSKGPIPERAVQSSLREALLAWHEESRSRREPPTVDACDTVLLEGRDFHDPEQVLRRRYGAGSLVLVRPDRVVHAHIPQSWLRPFLRRRFACRFDAGAARGAPSQVRWSWRRAPVAWPTAPTRVS